MSDELQLLKDQATSMGIPYSPNIGVEALKAKVAAKLAEDDVPAGGESDVEVQDDEPATTTKPGKISRAEFEQRERMRQHDEQMKLVRIRITNLNPAKKDLQGEIFTVANAFLGTVRKFIPYGEASDVGYHLPFVLYTELKDRKFSSIKTRRGPNGSEIIEERLVNEFAIEVLEPLTKDELAKLAAQQAAAAGLD